ncbi:cache domain-containing sensor histidine kinase [Paenibacillus thalictri]|uniref:histidine kinase n=1 Tax=Paenibacillus thalictri TaxID=2527873 RepID=A0A4V2J4A3_9BACL|nr:sensor histidine kinase [Paenibacillus thalictri]TBL78671.1 sensor histidine kinase [Paenibacillus thalictri]
MNRFPQIRMGIFAKLMVLLTIPTVLVLFGLLYTVTDSSKDALIAQKSNDQNLYIERTGQYLDLYLQNIRNILLSVSQHPVFSKPADKTEIENTLRTYSQNNQGLINHIFVSTRDGVVYSSSPVLFDIIGHPEIAHLFKIADENPGVISWSRPYYSPLSTEMTISFVLSVKDALGNDKLTIAAELDTLSLTRELGRFLYDQNQSYVLFNTFGDVIAYDGDVLADSTPGLSDRPASSELLRQLLELPNGIHNVNTPAGTVMATKSNRNRLGWYFVSLTKEEIFQQGVQGLTSRILKLGVLWYFLLFACVLVVSRQVTLPIRKLAKQMDRIKDGRLTLHSDMADRSDEIGLLAHSFQTMLKRIQRLVEDIERTEQKKKNIELRFLLNQIRPHFLYNTLSCISSLSRQNKREQVEETVRSLILILMYSIDRKNDFVPLQHELNTLKAYVQIQQMRYGSGIVYEDQVPEEHEAFLVPKMILQPLVENSIFHGLAGKGEGLISLQTELNADSLSITVSDDGEGMSEEKIASMMSGLSDLENETAKTTEKMSGIGLTNVLERLKLHYGDRSGVSMKSVVGKGTSITLTIPVDKHL